MFSCVSLIGWVLLSVITGEQRMNQAIEDIQAVEAEKLDAAVQAEKRKIEQLEETLTELRTVSNESKKYSDHFLNTLII